MRRDEAFVARALIDYLGGPSVASISDGADPPDLLVKFGTSSVGVEVTRLAQFTFELDGTFGNRATQDFFGLNLIEELNARVGPTLPTNVSLIVSLWMPVSNAARFRKALIDWVSTIATAPEVGLESERVIEGSKVCITVISEHPIGDKIVGCVVNKNSSADIGLNARLLLDDRIKTKSKTCSQLPKPIWLAVLNDYWLADAESYVVACRQLTTPHCFERILLIMDSGKVHELTVGK